MEIQRSESIAKLALALSKAQGKIKGAKKDSSNPFFKSKYTDLESVWDACRGPLTEHELSIVQIPTGGKDGVGLITVLMHSSGEWIAGELLLNPKANDPQGIGSALSYGRRYSLAAFSGVYQTDDDGEAAQGRATPQNGKEAGIKCDECGRDITGYTKPGGEVVSLGRVLEAGRKTYDRDICGGCQIALAKKTKAKPIDVACEVLEMDPGEWAVRGYVTELAIAHPMVLTLGEQKLQCWHKNSLVPFLKESKGKLIEVTCLQSNGWKCVERIHQIGDVKFVDNKPVSQTEAKLYA